MAGLRLRRLHDYFPCAENSSKHARPRAAARRTLLRPLLVLLLVLPLAACGDTDKTGERLAAQVNADRISVQEVDGVLARQPEVPPRQMNRARRDALEMLVDQQLAAQMALRRGLDREPEVAGDLDAARREVLARAYLSRVVSGLATPTDEETLRYYDDHPLLFAQRRYYVLREIAMPVKDAPVAALRALVPGKSVDQIADWLRAEGRTVSVSASTRPAEDIPARVLEALAQLKRGSATVIATPDGVFVVHLVATRDAPLDERTALLRIQNTLKAERARDAVAQEMAQIRAQSRIAYGSEFSLPDSEIPSRHVAAGQTGSTLLVAEPVAR